MLDDDILICLILMSSGNTSDFSVRLVNSVAGDVNPMEGQLEIYYSGVWGAVCNDAFTDNNAGVACASLGFGCGFLFNLVMFNFASQTIILMLFQIFVSNVNLMQFHIIISNVNLKFVLQSNPVNCIVYSKLMKSKVISSNTIEVTRLFIKVKS